jgi:hypothetical protein
MKTKTRLVRKVFVHRYRSQRVGMLFVGLTSSVGKNPRLIHLDFTHEFFPSLRESDEIEHRRVILAALAQVANMFDLDFSVLIPQVRVEEGGSMFAFSPSRNPVALPSPPGISITPPWQVVKLRRSRHDLLYAGGAHV